MKLLKFALLFCLYTTILCGQQEVPGYIVSLEGDTLRGRIVITDSKIKFRCKGEKSNFLRCDLEDYGYYGNNVFFSKPDIIVPAKKAETQGTIVLATGDTLDNFNIYSIRPESIRGYFEYPKYIDFEAKSGKLSELIIERSNQEHKIDLIEVKSRSKSGELIPLYAVRSFDKGLKAFNVSSYLPYSKSQKKYDPHIFLGFGIIGIAISEVIKENQELKIINTNGGFDDWIIHKNGKVYMISSIIEWKKKFDTIFENDIGFTKYLEKHKIKRSKIKTILKAYGDFIE